MKILWTWFVVLVLIGLAITFAPARAHEAAASEGIPEYVYKGMGCCGAGDCHNIPVENVALIEGGYSFRAPQPFYEDMQYTIAEGDPKMRDSSDGKYWACFYKPSLCKSYAGMYGGCKEYYARPPVWELRCFFRPVNA